MALTGTGANLVYQDASNGKLTFAWGKDGNPRFDDGETDTVMSLIYEARWYGDPSNKRRSQVSSINTKDASTPGRLKQYILDALQPAFDDGRLQSVTVDVQAAGIGYSALISYVTRAGQKAAQTVPLSV